VILLALLTLGHRLAGLFGMVEDPMLTMERQSACNVRRANRN
jgi:hypothetical protein